MWPSTPEKFVNRFKRRFSRGTNHCDMRTKTDPGVLLPPTMRSTILFASLLAILSATSACDSADPSSESSEPPVEPIEKSIKRGLAYDVREVADMEAVRSGVSWWYNWSHATSLPSSAAVANQTVYLPMLWGNDPDTEYAAVKEYILAHPEVDYLLVLNEPNLTDQANMTPQQAAAEWVKYEQLVAEIESTGRSINLVGPQMTWGTLTGFTDPVFWLDSFYAWYRAANEGREPRIDYLGFHWYDFGLEQQLDRLQKFGKQIWVTEMANWNEAIDTEAKQIEQMRAMVALCESRDDVFRYAWFTGRWADADRHTAIFESDTGQLTALGQAYLEAPY